MEIACRCTECEYDLRDITSDYSVIVNHYISNAYGGEGVVGVLLDKICINFNQRWIMKHVWLEA